MTDSKKNEPDPTRYPGFKRVVDHFFNTSKPINEKPLSVIISADSSDLMSAFDKLSNALPEVAGSVIELLDSGDELFSVDSDSDPATFAGEVIVRFKPNDGLADLYPHFEHGIEILALLFIVFILFARVIS